MPESGAISARGIRKRFGQVIALDNVSLDIRPRSIHALLGENGAGKSTLMRILFGLLQPDAGQVLVDDQPVAIRKPNAARRLGIGMVHQHFMLIEQMTVADNVLLGDHDAGFWQPHRQRQALVRSDAARLGLDVDPGALVHDLSVGQRQRVELLKVLRRPVRMLILDEPTAVLTPAEVETLFGTLRRLRDEGCGVVLITHKLDEATRLCDHVTVLRQGRTVLDAPMADADKNQLAEAMIGQGVTSVTPRRPGAPAAGEAVLEFRDVHTHRDDISTPLAGVNFTVRRGEIVGVAGVEGNGQKTLVEVIFGLRKPILGAVRQSAASVAHIPDDRQREGVVLSMSLAENAVLKSHAAPPFSTHGVMRWRMAGAHARDLIARFAIRASSERAAVRTLSGGNQQKLIAARELSGSPDLLVAVDPTRGLDMAATARIRSDLLARRDQGAGVLLISSDLDEIIELADRIVVMYRGRVHTTSWPDGGVDEIAALMAGAAT